MALQVAPTEEFIRTKYVEEVELPADIYVEWEDKDILPEVIKENRRRED